MSSQHSIAQHDQHLPSPVEADFFLCDSSNCEIPSTPRYSTISSFESPHPSLVSDPDCVKMAYTHCLNDRNLEQ